MAEQTVREQMAEALEGLCTRVGGVSWHRLGCDVFRGADEECDNACVRARRALDRHRAEPEHKCSLRNCGFGCPCYQEGRDEGIEAQRERVGRGTA